MAQSTPGIFAPAKLGPVTLRDRTIKAATYEGLTGKGLVTDKPGMDKAMAEGFDLVAIGRALLTESDLTDHGAKGAHRVLPGYAA